MVMMTSAYANKVLKRLNEDKEYWRKIENENYIYVAAADEEPVIPEYDYEMVAANIAQIDEKIVRIKHAINVSNSTNMLKVGQKEMTADAVLVRMAQLGRRKEFLDMLRKTQPKVRINSGYYNARKTAPEYQYINFDPDKIKADFEAIDAEIAAMQLALDKYNQTVEFEVDI